MKKFTFSFVLLVSILTYRAVDFRKAYALYPTIPAGMLEAVSWTQSRLDFLKPDPNQKSCIGYPETYGYFGLVEDGKNYFRNNLVKVAALSGFNAEKIKTNPEIHLMAYAKAFHKVQTEKGIFSNNPVEYIPVLIELSELPLDGNPVNQFAINSHLYQILYVLSSEIIYEIAGIQPYSINLQEVFGENYAVLSSGKVVVSDVEISDASHTHKFNASASVASPDYPPALWNPAASCNYSSRNGVQVSAVTIHFVQGTYAGCISWFQNCAAGVSAHYVVRSSDGQITQMVLEANKAWHVGTENPYTVGIEHEGYINQISWFTNAMYNASAALTKDICQSHNINPLRTYFGPSCSGSSSQCLLGSCIKVKGHQQYPNQTHTDPGPNWNWEKYYKLINDTYTITTTYTANSGNFYDTGGPSGNYGNDERVFWLFKNNSATNITLQFNSFNTEAGYDYIFVYDGGSVNSTLLSKHAGTVIPGPFTTSNDSLLLEFRSDCSTTAPGWNGSYTINATTPPPTDIIPPQTTVSTLNSWKTTTFTANFIDQDNPGGSGIQNRYYQVLDYNGTEWRANHIRGFFSDNFDQSIHPDWTQKTGTWSIQNNALVQTDETSTAAGNTNIYAALNQTLSNRYLYHFFFKLEGTGTNRRGGFHFFCDNADSSNRNNSYFVWFRLDNQKLQLYKVINNNFGTPVLDNNHSFVAGQWYDVKVIFDRVTGKIEIYWNNNLVATWTDPTPHTVGKFISFRSGNAKLSIDEIKVYRSRSSSAVVSVGSGTLNEIRHQNPSPTQPAGKIKSIVQDNAGNISPIHYHDLNIDWTPPSLVSYINDGKGPDINTVPLTDSLSANWGASSDPNSGISVYYYAIGTAPGATNVLGWTPTWPSNTVTAKNLVLQNNTTYYFSVFAENGAGLTSNVMISNGQTTDSTLSAISIYSLPDLNFTIYPNPLKNKIYFSKELQIETYLLTDINGKIVFIGKPKERSCKMVEISETIPDGVYFLIVQVNEQPGMMKKKIIVSK
ncbi:MAG: N-acetylmuramoyl-L-alanine amidase [Bacteroidia bacterium]|nr:N-acetylmuramoyl-L-alanine amidase [Bacteroidia bacterium]